MREIKFRAWNGQRMIHKYVFFSKTPLGWIHLSKEYGHGVKDVMQYTGLKDKNGKEIYEGDIVRVSNEDFQYEGDEPDYVTSAVEWSDCGYWDLEQPAPLMAFEQDKIEIIGNIHENKTYEGS